MTSPAEALNDAQLIDRVRADDTDAFAELRRRHRSDAIRTARITGHDPDEADRVAAAAFEQLHAALRAGNGPLAAVSPYLRTIIRRGALDAHRKLEGERSAVDPAAVDDLPTATDPLTAAEERNLVREAYESLPERWQRALWFTEIESRTPASLVPDLGSSANAVAALAYRAREALRQAYLAVHMSVAVSAACQPVVTMLPAYVRSALAPEDDVTVAIHLDSCVDCRNRRYELVLLVSNLRSVLAPALLGHRSGVPAETRAVTAVGHAPGMGMVVTRRRAARTSGTAALAAVGSWPRRAVKGAGIAAACVLAATALAWAASSAFTNTTSTDAAGGGRGPFAVTFKETTVQPQAAATASPWDTLDVDPAEPGAEPTRTDPTRTEPTRTEPTRTEPPEPGPVDEPNEDAPAASTNAAAETADIAPTASNSATAEPADTGKNTSGPEPVDSSTTGPAGDGATAGPGEGKSNDSGAGRGGNNQGPPEGSDFGPDRKPVPPAGNGDGDDDEEDELTKPGSNPDEEVQQKQPGFLDQILCGIFRC